MLSLPQAMTIWAGIMMELGFFHAFGFTVQLHSGVQNVTAWFIPLIAGLVVTLGVHRVGVN